MTAVPNELARKQPANLASRPGPQVIDGEARPAHSVFARTENTALKVIAILILAFGMFGFVIASLQTL